jgi:acyl carrier protein
MKLSLDRSRILHDLKQVFERATEGRVRADEVVETARVTEDLGVDSLNQLEIRFELERTWEMEVTDKEVKSLSTIGDVADLIVDRVARDAPAD